MNMFDQQDIEAGFADGLSAGWTPSVQAQAWPSEVDPSTALDLLACGVIITDRHAAPFFINRAASEILSGADGLRIDHGALGAALSAESAAIRRMIAITADSSTGGPSRAISISRPSMRRPLTVLIVPMRAAPSWSQARPPAVVVFINDPERSAPMPSVFLQELYDLTPAEAAVAIEIARGGGLQTVVEKFGISKTTARTHLQRAFAKTGTQRQAKLAWLIAESCAGLRLEEPAASGKPRRHSRTYDRSAGLKELRPAAEASKSRVSIAR